MALVPWSLDRVEARYLVLDGISSWDFSSRLSFAEGFKFRCLYGQHRINSIIQGHNYLNRHRLPEIETHT